jgi:peptidoglycan/xylan/chitin deacetylase (PgdA/CDA1 family)
LGADATVFVYHRFDDPKHQSTSISTEKLRNDFRYLRDNGYTVVPLATLVDLVRSGKPIPEKTVALTIDDNYKSFYTHGLPVFREFGYPFTLYVYVEATKKRYGDYMSWEELKKTAAFGEIGLHSFAHPHLTYLTSEAIQNDTQKAAALFEKRMGFKAASYAYPYGEFDERVERIIRKEGFAYICNQNAGGVASFSNPYSIDRIAIGNDIPIKNKLRTRSLQVKHLTLTAENNTLTKVEAVLSDPSIKRVEVFVSGYGWEWVKVNNAKVSYNTDKKLKLDRSRVIIKEGHRIASKLIMKRKNNGQ